MKAISYLSLKPSTLDVVFTLQSFRLCRNLFVFLSTLFLVTACGGGSSSSGSGGSGVGNYSGSATTTFRLGSVSTPVNGTITATVAANGLVSLNLGNIVRSAMRTGDTFSIPFPASFANSAGVSCVGSVSFNGTIGSNITGTVTSSANFACNGIPGSIMGTFRANRNARESVLGADFASQMSNALSQMP